MLRHCSKRFLSCQFPPCGPMHHLFLCGWNEDGVKATGLPVVLQACLVINQMQLALLVDEDVLQPGWQHRAGRSRLNSTNGINSMGIQRCKLTGCPRAYL